MKKKSSKNAYNGYSIYQVYPRSFQDTTGNGIGDLNGIRSRLAYIAHLGVDIVWISPFFKSPMKDFGYDVSDYKEVDPLFGTIRDFKDLLNEAHELGLKVMIDQVWSHSSDQHVWFEESRRDDQNQKADWYVWENAKPDGSPPNNWLSVFGGPAWTWDSGRHKYYLHNFLKSQPDLNLHNLDVQDAILDVARFWFEMGVDGFRLDACSFYFHDKTLRDNPIKENVPQGPKPHDWQDHKYCRSQPQNLEFLKRIRALADDYGGRLLLGEIGDDDGLRQQVEYTRGSNLLQMAYSFDMLKPDGSTEYIFGLLSRWLEYGEGRPVWALGNHDVPRLATRWGGAEPDPQQLRMFIAFLVCLDGPICIYQGEELGLEEVAIPFEELVDPDGLSMWPKYKGRDGCRTPMVWDSEQLNAGFTRSKKPWLRIGGSHLSRSVDLQENDPGSLVNHYRDLLAWRRNDACLRQGQMSLYPYNSSFIAWKRVWNETVYICVFNFTGRSTTVDAFELWETYSVKLLKGESIYLNEQLEIEPFGWGCFELAIETGTIGEGAVRVRQ